MKRIESVYFALKRGLRAYDDRYVRMARVLERSARMHCPGWEVNVREIDAPLAARYGNRGGRNGLATNTDKLREWGRIVDEAPDGDTIALLDSDMMALGTIDGAFATPFDVACTDKQHCQKLPFNGGAVFVRVNERSRAFMRTWVEVNDRLFANPEEHAPYRGRFGGMNQAALGYMLERMTIDVAFRWLPCATWNCCDEVLWRAWRGARLVHIKSGLRRAIFNGSVYRPHLAELRAIYFEHERALCNQPSLKPISG